MKKAVEAAFDVAPYRLFVGGGTSISALLAMLVVAAGDAVPREDTAAAIGALFVCLCISLSILVSGMLAAYRASEREPINRRPSRPSVAQGDQGLIFLYDPGRMAANRKEKYCEGSHRGATRRGR